MLTAKKIWERPKLIILERGRPEEMVLAGCKMPGSKQSRRLKNSGCERLKTCVDCKVLSTS